VMLRVTLIFKTFLNARCKSLLSSCSIYIRGRFSYNCSLHVESSMKTCGVFKKTQEQLANDKKSFNRQRVIVVIQRFIHYSRLILNK
jgi:uncharacterized membrane protein YqjE